MTPNQTCRLAELDAHLSHLIGFQKRDDDRPSSLGRAAKVAGLLATGGLIGAGAGFIKGLRTGRIPGVAAAKTGQEAVDALRAHRAASALAPTPAPAAPARPRRKPTLRLDPAPTLAPATMRLVGSGDAPEKSWATYTWEKLRGLDAHLSHLIGFQKRDDDPNALKKAALGTAAAAGGAGLAALYARGRLARNGGKWGSATAAPLLGVPSTVQGTVLRDVKSGLAATGADIAGAAHKGAGAVTNAIGDMSVKARAAARLARMRLGR